MAASTTNNNFIYADSYNVAKNVPFLKKTPQGIIPMCLCGNQMVSKGIKLVCAQQGGKCPMTVTKEALQFWSQHGYLDFNSKTENNEELMKYDVPICNTCYKTGGELSLMSYLGQKCLLYPSYQGVVWRCSCKTILQAGKEGKLMNGWKKFGPSIDNPSAVVKGVDGGAAVIPVVPPPDMSRFF